ncbi:MAG: HEPN domain-containing protein [Candidatus Rokuibacteriota bacterium]
MRWDLAAGWLAKADEDLGVAEVVLEGRLPTYGAVRFHAQQAAEKALKALLVRHQIPFGRTHDLGELLQLAEPHEPGIAEVLAEAEALTPYAVRDRYPTSDPPVPREDASSHLTTARKTVGHVRSVLKPYLDAGRPGTGR